MTLGVQRRRHVPAGDIGLPVSMPQVPSLVTVGDSDEILHGVLAGAVLFEFDKSEIRAEAKRISKHS